MAITPITRTLLSAETSIKLIRSELQGLLRDVESGALVDAARASLDPIIDGLKNNMIPLITNTQVGLYGLFGYLTQNLDSIPAKIAAVGGAFTLNNVGNLPAYAPLSRCA